MARLLTTGAEGNNISTSGGVDGLTTVATGTGVVTCDASVFRSGARSIKTNTGATSTSLIQANFAFTGANGTNYYGRAYVQITAAPTTAHGIVVFQCAGGDVICRMRTDKALELVHGSTTVVGSPSAVLTIGQWYRVELHVNTSASASSSTAELYLDGTLVASTNTALATGGAPIGFYVGNRTTTGTANYITYFDDIAVNDDVGGNQNTFPGSGKVVLLLPISDNSAGSWRAGSAASAAANGALFAGIDNTPPAGTSTPDSVTSCISNNISGATNPNGDFNMTTYTTAGVGAGDTINCIQMIIVHGEDIATNTKTGTFTIQSNPATGVTDNVSQGGTNQFGPTGSGAVGAYPSNWVVQRGTITYAPSVTVGNSPIGRITKTDTGTRAADCCFMGIYVDYTPLVIDNLMGQECW